MQESAESFVLRGSMSMFAVPASAAINVVYGMDLLMYDCLYNLFESVFKQVRFVPFTACLGRFNRLFPAP
jgi:hypothetical protein